LNWKQQRPADARACLTELLTCIEGISDEHIGDAQLIEQNIKALIAEKGWGNGESLWPLRVALSGQEKSPGPFDLIVAYGKRRSLERIKDAIQCLDTLG
jgi:glutamyl-tRNA synthetase